jgi:NADH-quinone oxidoreductase subunit M
VSNILTLITFSPLLGMLALLLMPKPSKDVLRTVTAVTTFVPLVLASWLWMNFDTHDAGYQFVVRVPWISALGVEYFLGIDGLSVPMVWLTTLLLFLATFASWNIEKGVKGYMLLLLLLEVGINGVFCSLDLFLFYVFWEVMLLPMYFLIGIWGGPRREYAAIKFFLYTLAGSVLMLLGIVALYLAARDTLASPFSIPELSALVKGGQLTATT